MPCDQKKSGGNPLNSEPVSRKETARWAGADERGGRESPISLLVKITLQTEEKQEAPEADMAGIYQQTGPTVRK